MLKRNTAILLVAALGLSIAPVASAAPRDRLVGEGGLTGYVQAVWDDLVSFLGFGPGPHSVEPERAGEPRAREGRETVGPHIDP